MALNMQQETCHRIFIYNTFFSFSLKPSNICWGNGYINNNNSYIYHKSMQEYGFILIYVIVIIIIIQLKLQKAFPRAKLFCFIYAFVNCITDFSGEGLIFHEY